MTNLFLLLVIYQLKHFVADYILQSHPFFIGKFLPGWKFVKPLSAHCGIHALMTMCIAVAWGASDEKAALLALLDFVIHFLMDRLKASPKWLGRWKALSGAEYMADHLAWSKATSVYTKCMYAKKSWRTEEGRLAMEAEEKDVTDKWLAATAHRKKRRLHNNLFWNCLGFDQMVHHLTHYAVIWFLVNP